MVVASVLNVSLYTRFVENKLVYLVMGRSDSVVPPLNTESYVNVLFEI